MRVSEYLKKNNMSQYGFCKLTGIGHGQLWRHLNQNGGFSWPTARLIERVTKGEVTIDECGKEDPSQSVGWGRVDLRRNG